MNTALLASPAPLPLPAFLPGHGQALAPEVNEAAAMSSDVVVPALGVTWHHCVSTRLVLQQFPTFRVMEIAKSPIAQAVATHLTMTSAGLQELAEGEENESQSDCLDFYGGGH